MTSTDGNHARPTFPSAKVRKLINNRLPGPYKWTQQGAIQFPKTETYQSKSEPGKDHNTHDPWQET
jgi:hypothetical protein